MCAEELPPRRRPLRLPAYDYSAERLTFVTFCTARRGNILGSVADATVQLNWLGLLTAASLAAAEERGDATLDCADVMPDHVHALLVVHRGLRLWDVVGAVKARVTRRSGSRDLWQRSFHDHVVRDEADLERSREYISTNPLRWEIARREIAQ